MRLVIARSVSPRSIQRQSEKDFNMPEFQISQRVRIQKPDNCQHNREGLIVEFDAESNSYCANLDGQLVQVAEEYLADATFDWGEK